MAVAIKKHGFRSIKIFNGGLTDWKRSGLPLESISPLPEYNGTTISPQALEKIIVDAEARQCRDETGEPLLTLIDFRASVLLKEKIGADRYHVKTSCPEIMAQLDDFLENKTLTDRIPRHGRVVCISETGKRDNYLQRYLHTLGLSGIISLQNGMRGWLKAGFPTEKTTESPE